MTDMVGTILKVGMVLLLLGGLAWYVKRGANRGADGSVVSVISRANVGARASVAVVKVADNVLVLGVTENQVNLLTTMSSAAIPAADLTPAGGVANPTADFAATIAAAKKQAAVEEHSDHIFGAARQLWRKRKDNDVAPQGADITKGGAR